MRRDDGDPMTTAIYPGTFDPVTSGHVDVPNIEVEAFDGLLVDFAAQHGASVVVRGLRTTDSLSNELAMAVTNRGMNPDLQVLFLPASEEAVNHRTSMICPCCVVAGPGLPRPRRTRWQHSGSIPIVEPSTS
jgi:phosphopantetheine adenylyltransferase